MADFVFIMPDELKANHLVQEIYSHLHSYYVHRLFHISNFLPSMWFLNCIAKGTFRRGHVNFLTNSSR